MTHQLRLFYIGLWNFADKAGRLEDRPKWLKVEIFPYENADTEKMLKVLTKPKSNSCRPFIQRYILNNKKYIQILSWSIHQKPHHQEQESILPEPPLMETLTETETETETESVHVEHAPNMHRTTTDYFSFEKTVMSEWNKFCDKNPQLSSITKITNTRRKFLKTRFKDKEFLKFDEILEAIEEQSFLLEGNPRSKDHKNWKISFDWLIANDTNYIKVLERRYKGDENADIPDVIRECFNQ